VQFPGFRIATSGYSRFVRKLLTQNAIFFLGVSLAALAFRMAFVFWFPAVVDDSRLYANIAENWLQHGIYGVTNDGHIMPTLSRLPGYPAFLAMIFAVFGIDNFRAVLIAQVLFDLGSCFLIADMARRVFSERAAKAAFLLAALCPFLANYSAAALTETLEIFFTALALNRASAGLQADSDVSPTTWRTARTWLACGLSIGAAILLRPDGGILLAAIGGYLLWRLARALTLGNRKSAGAIVLAGVVVGAGAVAPLIPWTLRNLHTLHRFEPLAPRYANDSDEPVMNGFNRWTKTWIADYVSVQEIYWNVPGEAIEASKLPKRATDSADEQQQTAALFDDYNRDHDMTPDLDARFATLAAERIQSARWRYYVELPAMRISDMWLRPRTELFPSDPRWWEFNDDRKWLAVSIILALVNLAYVGAAVLGLLRSHGNFGVGLFVLFVLLRSAFLGTLENPEPRYTLECYPVAISLASSLFAAAHRLPGSKKLR
jgi:4-amino-4-deoxy-L-arabinose transferase-like glycosyltransferase